MYQTTAVPFFCFVLYVVYASTTTHHSNLIKWVNITEISISNLEPVGGEVVLENSERTNVTTYLARTVYHDSLDSFFKQLGIIPGKYVMNGSVPFRLYMYYSLDGIQYSSTEFEVLTYPRGSVSWISEEKLSPLDEKVVGGIDPFTSELLYLCRLNHITNDSRPYLIPGKLTNAGDCMVPLNGEITSNVTYEVLVVNAYGKYMGA